MSIQAEGWDENVREFFRQFQIAKEEKLSVEASPPRVNKAKMEYDLLMAEATDEFHTWENRMKGKWDADKQKGRDHLLKRATARGLTPNA